ncbi:biotin--[acetyl-CoA-carboxylase] ligase [Candidatus Bipolaricaulota bacterium]|nr:biotin--[acetyl-CoA-carboxylase] ligase [Candidatus Bipolaricaulota bacterium]
MRGPATELPTIHRFPEVDSTQDTARELLRIGRAKTGHIVTADVQAAGRGRYGRSWLSPAGGLYATLILEQRPLISLACGVAIARAFESFELAVALKWPNDVEHDGRKLAGTLIETVDDRLLVGIGVNLLEAPLSTSTSAQKVGVNVRRGDLLLAIWQHLQGGNEPGEVLTAYRERSATIGRRVRVTSDEQRAVEGIAIDIDENGQLRVQTEGGVEIIASGTCVHLA